MLVVVFSLVAIQSLVECKLKWFLFPSKFFLSTQHSSAEIFSHCIFCSAAVHFPTSHDALHSLRLVRDRILFSELWKSKKCPS